MEKFTHFVSVSSDDV